MKSFAIFVAAALFTAVSGRVLEARDTSTSSNVEVQVEHLPAFVPLTTPGVVLVEANSVKHKREEHITKRATLTVDIYRDVDYGGRHEGLVTDTQKCYNLGNGWNDEISSLVVPKYFSCYFYINNGCNSKNSLLVHGPYSVSHTGDYGYNDNISSYLCYN